MADAADSKSVYGDIVRVQVPPPAFKIPYRIDAFELLELKSNQKVIKVEERRGLLYIVHPFIQSANRRCYN